MIPEKFSSADMQFYKCQFYQFHILTLYCHEVCLVVSSSCHFLAVHVTAVRELSLSKYFTLYAPACVP